jgi:hypothetical protein
VLYRNEPFCSVTTQIVQQSNAGDEDCQLLWVGSENNTCKPKNFLECST